MVKRCAAGWSMIALLSLTAAAPAQFHRKPATVPAPATQPAVEAAKTDEKGDKLSVTRGSITLDGQPFPYRATAGTLAMKDEAGKLKADVFFVAYDTESTDLTTRPLTFLFNGGPGAASVWLHLGGCGPKVVDLDAGGIPVGPPYKLVENPATWLRGSDLVFVDPVSTGYSRPAAGESGDQFHGYKPDLASCADFVRVYLSKYGRWGSPLYLAGESYGTTRCAGLAGYLAERYGIAVHGVTLVSSVLDFATLSPSPGNDLPYQMFLPSYAAVAWYHKKLSPEYQADFDKTMAAVRKFTVEEYGPALMKGASVTPEQHAKLVKQLAGFTGLSEDRIERANLRINPGEFEKQVLGDGRHITGRYDGRITGFDPSNDNGPAFDPSFSYYLPAYSAAFNQYVRDELKYDNDVPYEVLTGRVHPWPMNEGGPLYVTDDLQETLLEHPGLRVQFVSGWFDLATPFFAADYTIDRMNLSPAARANVTHVYYPSGHMIYHNRAAAKQLAEAMERFVKPTATTRPAR